MSAQCGSICHASQNIQFSIPQNQGLYNCGYMNGNPVSSCMPTFVAAQNQSICNPSGYMLNNSLVSVKYFSDAQVHSYAPQIGKYMTPNGGSEYCGCNGVRSNMLSSYSNHGVTQNGINLFASSDLCNVHQYNGTPSPYWNFYLNQCFRIIYLNQCVDCAKVLVGFHSKAGESDLIKACLQEIDKT